MNHKLANFVCILLLLLSYSLFGEANPVATAPGTVPRAVATGSSLHAIANRSKSQTKREKKPKEKPQSMTSHVILISIDGLRIEDLDNPKINIPTLKALRERGAFALNVESIYPTQNLPAHATMVTGMFPSDHGITSDYHFDEQAGITAPEKRFSGSELKTDSIWQAAKRAGLKTATINSPITEKAEVDFNSQEINSAAEFIEKNRPNLTLVYFDDFLAAPEKFDALLKQIINSVERAGITNETTFLIVSGHGYAKVEQEFRPNLVLAKKGFLTTNKNGEINSWIAVAQSFGGSAAIYLKDEQNEQAIKSLAEIFEEIHETEGSPITRVISRKALSRLGSNPRAAIFIEAAPGFIFSEKATGKKPIEKLTDKADRSASGYLPSRYEMRGALIAAGKGIKPKTQIEYAQLVDIAPTIARLLGLELKASRGHIISEILIQQKQK